MIGDEIEITIVAVDGDQVKLGITAPKNIDIHRKEIYLSIQNENNEAIKSEANLIDNLSTFFKQNK